MCKSRSLCISASERPSRLRVHRISAAVVAGLVGACMLAAGAAWADSHDAAECIGVEDATQAL